MKTCLVALTLILLIEGFLAWAAGMPQLIAMLAALVGVGSLSSLWKRRGGEWAWVPLVGLYCLASVLIFGFFKCGFLVAMSALHFVAWYYAARGLRFGAPELLPGTLGRAAGDLLDRFLCGGCGGLCSRAGRLSCIAPSLAIPLAFVLFVLGLLVMEKGRFLRMREGAPDRASRTRGMLARGLAAIAVLALMFFLFAKPVPAVADGLVTMVRDLQGKTDDPGTDADDMPPPGDVPEGQVGVESGMTDDESANEPGEQAGGQRAGDSMSKARKLPKRADIQGSHVPVVYLKLESLQQAAALARQPVYVRSSTLGRYEDNEWRRVAEDREMRWIEDRHDGKVDERVSLPLAFPELESIAEVEHDVYVREASGAGLLALQGVSEFNLPRVYRYGDDWYRAALTGNVAYSAGSRPLALEDLLAVEDLRAGRMAAAYIDVEPSDLMRRMRGLMDDMPSGTLGERLIWLKQFLAANYTYSTKIENLDERDPLENFLFHEKRGYCDFFATTGALMTRMMGIPSRIGYGYTKGSFDGKNVFTFHEDEAHSWTEIYLKDYGWVVFDVTPSEAGAPPGAQGPEQQSESPDLTAFEGESGSDDVAGVGGDDSKLNSDDIKKKNAALSDLVLYAMFCVALAAFGLWYFLKKDPEREAEKAAERAGKKAHKLPAYLAEFVSLVRALGLDPQQGETIVELLRLLRGAGVQVDGFEAMKDYHYSTRYGGEPADPRQEKQLLQEVRSFLKEQLRSQK